MVKIEGMKVKGYCEICKGVVSMERLPIGEIRDKRYKCLNCAGKKKVKATWGTR